MRILVNGATATMRRLAPLFPDTLGWLTTPRARNDLAADILPSGLPWAIDNGCFVGLDRRAFLALLERAQGQPRLLWVAAPDVVADAVGTLARWDEWGWKIKEMGYPVAFVAQDGCERVGIPWDDLDAVFLGGSTEWKLGRAAAAVAAAAKELRKPVHMGRVNSQRRLEIAYRMGCDTVDGSGMSLFANTYIESYCRFVEGLGSQSMLAFPS